MGFSNEPDRETLVALLRESLHESEDSETLCGCAWCEKVRPLVQPREPFKVGDRVEYRTAGVIRFWESSDVAHVELDDGTRRRVPHHLLRHAEA